MTNKVDASEKTILIIDDDESICLFLKTLLEKEGFKTEITCKGNRAVDIVGSKKIDMVILDWMMPILSGFEVLKLLQTDEHRGIPIIVITARVTDSHTINIIKQEINVVDFLPKPIKHALFVGRVHQVLNTMSSMERSIQSRYGDNSGSDKK